MSKPRIKINDESDAPAESPILGREDDDDKQQARDAEELIEGNSAHVSNQSSSAAAQETPRKELETQHSNAEDLGADPLSLRILQRARIDHRYKNDEDESTLAGRSPEIGSQEGASSKDRKKSGSFFSRLIGGTKQNVHEDDSETADNIHRSEGVDAHVFSQPVGFIAQHPQPPKYIRVRAHNKRKREFDRVFLAQELSAGLHEQSDKASFTGSMASISSQSNGKKSNAIWTMKFSRDGKYLATGGQDMVVRVWSLLSTEKDRRAHEEEEEVADERREGEKQRIHAPVFRSDPFREYSGHTADVLDLSWSKNNFLLSSSMDKTVRLWHVSRKECLCAFQHTDFVTAIMFHPRDDRFFLSGSLDSKLRLWSIPEKEVAYWNELADLITAVAFTPDGRTAIAGSFTGLCLFYETEGLRYHTQIHVRSSRGRNSRGGKITGIETISVPPEETSTFVKILVTSNDSRVRMYNLRDKTLEGKFKGYENTCSQIRASFSDNGKYVISGSEDKRVFIWDALGDTGDKKSREPYEYFQAHNAIVTVALLAPTKSRQLLASSGDPIYDLCCPPPVKLRSASAQHSGKSSDSEKLEGEASAENTPSTSRNITPIAPAMSGVSRQQFLRSLHYDGNIIVTADYHGRIKVFRQDCAYVQREHSENQSLLAGKRAKSGMFGAAQKQDSGLVDGRSWRGSLVSNRSSTSSLRSESQEDMRARHRSVSPRKSALADSLTPSGPASRRASSSSAEPGTGTKPPARRNMWDMATGASMTYYDDTRNATLDLHRPSQRKLSFAGSTASADLSPDPFAMTDESGEEEERELRCSHCGKTNFVAKTIPGDKGKPKLQCTK